MADKNYGYDVRYSIPGKLGNYIRGAKLVKDWAKEHPAEAAAIPVAATLPVSIPGLLAGGALGLTAAAIDKTHPLTNQVSDYQGMKPADNMFDLMSAGAMPMVTGAAIPFAKGLITRGVGGMLGREASAARALPSFIPAPQEVAPLARNLIRQEAPAVADVSSAPIFSRAEHEMNRRIAFANAAPQMKDATGKPITVYFGGANPNKINFDRMQPGVYSEGAYATGSLPNAEDYASRSVSNVLRKKAMGRPSLTHSSSVANPEETVIPLNLNLERPFDFNARLHPEEIKDIISARDPDIAGMLPENATGKHLWDAYLAKYKNTPNVMDNEVLPTRLKELGYDGMIYGSPEEKGALNYVWWDPTKAKHAFLNSGEYSPLTSNIYRALPLAGTGLAAGLSDHRRSQ